MYAGPEVCVRMTVGYGCVLFLGTHNYIRLFGDGIQLY